MVEDADQIFGSRELNDTYAKVTSTTTDRSFILGKSLT